MTKLRQNPALSAIAIIGYLSGYPAEAHHSVAATFDLTRSMTIVGILTGLDWRNPHSEFIVETEEANGAVKAWLIQGSSVSRLQRQNFTKGDFDDAVGQVVTVEVHPAKEGSRYGALAVQVVLPDGRIAILNSD